MAVPQNPKILTMFHLAFLHWGMLLWHCLMAKDMFLTGNLNVEYYWNDILYFYSCIIFSFSTFLFSKRFSKNWFSIHSCHTIFHGRHIFKLNINIWWRTAIPEGEKVFSDFEKCTVNLTVYVNMHYTDKYFSLANYNLLNWLILKKD